jgi:predicted small secreted protein
LGCHTVKVVGEDIEGGLKKIEKVGKQVGSKIKRE